MRIAKRAQAARIIVIGDCDIGELAQTMPQCELVLIQGQRRGIQAVAPASIRAQEIKVNLEEGLAGVSEEIFDRAVVICSGVFERLQRPLKLASALADRERRTVAVLMCAADHLRLAVPEAKGPPTSFGSLSEWTAEDFKSFLKSAGFGRDFFLGHTEDKLDSPFKTSVLAIAGGDLCYVPTGSLIKVAAIINTYNEQDIILEVLQHLAQNGVEAHVFDNWSSDGTYEMLQCAKTLGLCANVAKFPDSPSDQYEWAKQLHNADNYARGLDADWILNYDADELRESPWADVNLQAGMSFVDSLGYTAIDFTVINFRFLEGQIEVAKPYELGLLNFEFGDMPGHFRQIKGWKNLGRLVGLAQTGGHEAVFPERKIFPINFLNKHYPLRSHHQAEKKIFTDRLPRFVAERKRHGWHVQYDEFRGADGFFGWNQADLTRWGRANFDSEFLVERLSGIGVKGAPNSEVKRSWIRRCLRFAKSIVSRASISSS